VSITHHGDHRALLRPVKPFAAAAEADVDAIIVPSARTAPYILKAARVAEQLECVLVVLCSKLARHQELVAKIADNVVIDVVGVDIPSYPLRLPDLRTSTLLKGTGFERRTDTSVKRNAGLALSRMVGWSRVVFLDDDIDVPDPTDLRRAAAALSTNDGVGLAIGGFPDNSVVCHAHRGTGGCQATFVGGGALAVPADRISSFFPEIYNEDWFFLLDGDGLRPAALTGVAKQEPYDPFADPERARREEFGDVLAEGIFSLLDGGRSMQRADEAFWSKFLGERNILIDDILRRLALQDIEPAQKKRMVTSLKAARGRLKIIAPALCVQYLEAWHEDRVTWSKYIEELPSGLTVERALSYLRLRGCFTAQWKRTGPQPREPHLRDARRRVGHNARRAVLPGTIRGVPRTNPRAPVTGALPARHIDVPGTVRTRSERG
jgi:hypothetical protein